MSSSHGTLKEDLRDVAFTTATPFTADREAVDHEALAANLEALYEAGGRLFIPCGNTGEYYALSRAERVEIVRMHVERLPADATVVAGVAGSTKTARDLIETHEESGVDGVMVMHPDHTYLHRDGLVEYYERLADAAETGVVLYKRGHDVPDDVLTELTAHESVVGAKYAVNDVKGFSAAVGDAAGDAVWLTGSAERYAPAYHLEGARGLTTGIGNFAPEAPLALFDALEARDYDRAREIRDLLRPFEDLREEPGENNDTVAANNVPAVKRAMDLAGLEGGPVREPLVELSEADRERVSDYYERIREADL
jgi:4-hydroxy-tetrahydrodipicolinate synthase